MIDLIVIGFTAVGTASMLFFCEQTNAGRHSPEGISLIRKDPRMAQGVWSRFWGVAAGRIGCDTVHQSELCLQSPAADISLTAAA